MKSLAYLLNRQFLNMIKQLVKKPATLIGYIIFLLLISMNAILYLFVDHEAMRLPFNYNSYLLTTIILLGITTVSPFIAALNKGQMQLKKGDVGFLFSGPFKPVHILIYAQIKNSGKALGAMFIVLIQAPVFTRNLGVTFHQMLWMIFILFAISLMLMPITMVIYVMTERMPEHKMKVKLILGGYGFVIAGWFIYNVMTTANLYTGIRMTIENAIFGYLPIIGWGESLFLAVVNGIGFQTVFAVLMFVLCSVISWVLSKKYADNSFYESAASQSEHFERARNAKKKGDFSFSSAMQKKKKVKTVQAGLKKKGAMAIVERELLIKRKQKVPWIDHSSLFAIGASIIIAYLIVKNSDSPIGQYVIAIALLANAYIIFIFTMRSNHENLKKHYIFMIPVSIYKKLFSVVFIQGLKYFIDGLLSVIALAIVFKTVNFDIIVVPFTILFFGLQMYLMDMILDRLFGSKGTGMLKFYAKTFGGMITILPGIIVGIVLLVIDVPLTLAILFSGLIFAAVDIGLYFLAARIFAYPDLVTN